jgi:ATP phosphoribosyltransferase regulatory subunit
MLHFFSMTTLMPSGVSDFLPSETDYFDKIIRTIEQTFKQNGYKKVRTPTLEFFDTLKIGMGPDLDTIGVKLFDAQGRVLVLRPDHTVPIARLAATRLADSPLPLPLYYFNPIYRSVQHGLDSNIEIFQAGVELIGKSGPEAEAAVIVLCIETLLALGIKEFGIDIGHVNFINEYKEEDRQALLRGDYVALGSIPKRGSVELVKDYADLVKLYECISAKGYGSYITFNKGMVKELHYYSGLIFECYIPGMKQSVGSGGRYDHLLGKYGFDCPAVGFALSIGDLNIEDAL